MRRNFEKQYFIAYIIAHKFSSIVGARYTPAHQQGLRQQFHLLFTFFMQPDKIVRQKEVHGMDTGLKIVWCISLGILFLSALVCLAI